MRLFLLVTTVYAMEEARRNLELKRPEAIHHLERLTFDSPHFGPLYGKPLEGVTVVNLAMALQIILEQSD